VEDITIGQIISTIGGLTVIVGFFVTIIKWYKKNFTDKFANIEERLVVLEEKEVIYQKELQDSKDERLILLKGQLACLKGLHNDLKCNGPVTQGIKEVEEYLIRKSHE
jgi:hypothetical protein